MPSAERRREQQHSWHPLRRGRSFVRPTRGEPGPERAAGHQLGHDAAVRAVGAHPEQPHKVRVRVRRELAHLLLERGRHQLGVERYI